MNSNQFAWPKVVRKSGFHRILYESLAHYGNACEKINGMYCLKKRLTGFQTKSLQWRLRQDRKL